MCIQCCQVPITVVFLTRFLSSIPGLPVDVVHIKTSMFCLRALSLFSLWWKENYKCYLKSLHSNIEYYELLTSPQQTFFPNEQSWKSAHCNRHVKYNCQGQKTEIAKRGLNNVWVHVWVHVSLKQPEHQPGYGYTWALKEAPFYQTGAVTIQQKGLTSSI